VKHGFGQFRGYVSGNVDFFSHVDQAGQLDWWRDAVLDNEPGYTTHLITRHSLAFIEANKDKPFCLYMPYEPPHYPYQGPHDSPIRSVGKARGPAESEQSQAQVQQAYKEMVEEMDKGIGEIIAALKKHEIDQNTLVMFFSDNGGTKQGSNGPLRGNKGQVWEGGHRVPCIASWPGKIPAGSVSNDLAITLDVMPTLLAAAGIDPPKDRPLDGINLLPHLTEAKPLGERSLFWQHGNSSAMRKGHWKLVVNAPGQKPAGLFHLGKDMAEQENQANDQPDLLKEMQASLKSWEADVATGSTPQPSGSRQQ
jgi:arylsulfatase A-like enzyme